MRGVSSRTRQQHIGLHRGAAALADPWADLAASSLHSVRAADLCHRQHAETAAPRLTGTGSRYRLLAQLELPLSRRRRRRRRRPSKLTRRLGRVWEPAAAAPAPAGAAPPSAGACKQTPARATAPSRRPLRCRRRCCWSAGTPRSPALPTRTTSSGWWRRRWWRGLGNNPGRRRAAAGEPAAHRL